MNESSLILAKIHFDVKISNKIKLHQNRSIHIEDTILQTDSQTQIHVKLKTPLYRGFKIKQLNIVCEKLMKAF